jgi:hypothetical protein
MIATIRKYETSVAWLAAASWAPHEIAGRHWLAVLCTCVAIFNAVMSFVEVRHGNPS